MPITQKAYKPQIQQAGRQAAVTAKLPGVRQNVDANAFGAAEAQAKGRVAAREHGLIDTGLSTFNKAYHEYDAAKYEEEKSLAREALAKADRRANEFSASQMSLTGKNAIMLDTDLVGADGVSITHVADKKDVAKRTAEEMQRIREEVMGTLESTRAREMFASSFSPIAERHYENSLKHLETQREVFRQNTLSANIEVNRNEYIAMALSGSADENAMKLQRQMILGDIKAKYKGQSENVAALKYREQMEVAHVSAIRGFIAKGQEGQAYNYFEKLKSSGRSKIEMSSAMIADVEKEIESANIHKSSILLTNSVLGAVPTTEENYKQKQRDMIREVVRNNPKLLDETLKRLHMRHQEQDMQLALRREGVTSKAAGVTLKAKTASEALKMVDDIFRTEHYLGVEKDHVAARAAINAHYMQAFRDAKALKDGADVKTNPLKRAEVYRLIDGGHIKSTEMLFAKYRQFLSAADFDKVDTYMRKGGAKSEVSDSKMRQFYADAMGIKKNDIDEEKYASFQTYALDQIDSIEDTSDAGLTKLVRDIIIKDKEEGFSPGGMAVFDPGAATTRGGARQEGKSFMTEGEHQGYTETLKSLGLPTSGVKSQDENLKWGLHSRAQGNPPASKYESNEKFEMQAREGLKKLGINPTNSMLTLLWLHEAGLVTDDQFRSSAIKAKQTR